jgi:precorrin-6B methylase 2
MLDVGGGSGVYAIAAVEAHPALHATVLEHPPVDRIARRAIAAAGCGDRVSVVVGDMFADPWPADHDMHLFSNVLHDWDEPDCRRLLEKSAASLPAGGRIVVHDMFLDDAKDGPLWAAEYSVLLASVTNGRLYAAGEIADWGRALGFVASKPVSLPLGRGFLVLSRQP